MKIPICLTPNFDDLLYDSFYLFLNEKPLLINHEALTEQYRINKETPTIVKLHGDYLYDNIKNLDNETDRLEDNMENIINKCLEEFGLVVLGYSGRDKSIMNVLKNLPPTKPPHGLWWCQLDSEERDDLSDDAMSLLEKRENFLVKIKDSETFFSSLNKRLDTSSIPQITQNLEEIMSKRTNMLSQEMEKDTEGPETDLYLTEAINEYREGNKEKSYELLEKAQEMDPANAEVYFVKGTRFLRDEDHQKAKESFSEAIELDPQYSKAYNKRGFVKYRLGDFSGAISDFSQAIKIEPNNVEYLFNLAYMYDVSGKSQDAIDIYTSILENENIEDSQEESHFQRGLCHMDLDNYKEAISDFTESLILNPDSVRYFESRGEAFENLSLYDSAILDYSRAIELSPTKANNYFNRGNIYAKLNQYGLSMTNYYKGLKLSSSEP